MAVIFIQAVFLIVFCHKVCVVWDIFLEDGFLVLIILIIMYNSFIFKKHSEQLEQQQNTKRKSSHWVHNYKSNVRPALIQKYSRRINNFVIRLQQDKKQLYQYRQETQAKARELLKQIYYKQQFLGDPNIKLRDTRDWSSILSTTERIQHQKNKKVFQTKFGDSSLAFRSIASQSAYNPAAATQFRNRQKKKEIHSHNMRFTTKSQSFSQNRRQKEQRLARSSHHHLTEIPKDIDLNRSNSNVSHIDDQVRSHAFSIFSVSGDHHKMPDQAESSVSNQKESVSHHQKDSNNNNKVYFKQIVDLEQHSQEPTIKKSLHQILVRFGISRIKDLKKQAMVETDNLESDDF